MSFINQSFVIIQLDSNLGNIVLLSFLVMINIITVGAQCSLNCVASGCYRDGYNCCGIGDFCPPPATSCGDYCHDNPCPTDCGVFK